MSATKIKSSTRVVKKKKSAARKVSRVAKKPLKKPAKKKSIRKKSVPALVGKPAAVEPKEPVVIEPEEPIVNEPIIEEPTPTIDTPSFDLNELPSLIEEATKELSTPDEPDPLPEAQVPPAQASFHSRLSFYMGVFFGAIVLHALVVSVLVFMTV